MNGEWSALVCSLDLSHWQRTNFVWFSLFFKGAPIGKTEQFGNFVRFCEFCQDEVDNEVHFALKYKSFAIYKGAILI